ncbi:MAG TPA: DoxX family protein, partial [Propionibacterium sp.]|nr:DoxX family protein [Propionibacterium sp.]
PVPVHRDTTHAAPAAAGVATGATAAADLPVRTETVTVTERSTDKFAGSLGLFLLRLVTAAIIGVHGLQHLLDLPGTTEMIQTTVLPASSILSVVLGAAEVAIAIALVFGLLTRLAGLGLALVAGGALAFVQWGASNPFRGGEAGFTGELELLLVGVGILFMLVGAGGWSVDHGFRARKRQAADA